MHGAHQPNSFLTPAGDAGRVLDPLRATDRSGYLFPNSDGQPYVQMSTNFDQTMRRVLAAERADGSDFARFRVHDLRHAFAVRWLEAGVTCTGCKNISATPASRLPRGILIMCQRTFMTLFEGWWLDLRWHKMVAHWMATNAKGHKRQHRNSS
jgi:hypothetical protein